MERSGMRGDAPGFRLRSIWLPTAALLQERRELRAFVGHEHRDQFGRLGGAGIGGDHVSGARRLEEGLANLEGFDRAPAELGADFALGDIGGTRARVTMRTRKA